MEPKREPGTARTAVTMRDVARATGVSQSTVSRVLSGAPTTIPIAPETRMRVAASARDLGYRPNPLARGLRGLQTMLLGVIVREITDPFFAGAIEAVTIEAGRRGYNVVLGHAHGRADEAIALWGVLEARHCDAILLLGDMSDQPALIDDLRDAAVPVAALWQGDRADGVPSVGVDNAAGIVAVMDYLVGLGHEQLAFVAGRRLGDIREREAAFVAYLRDPARPVVAGAVQYAGDEPAGAERALAALLALEPRPTALVASTDVLAMRLLHVADRLGVRVPDDLSVIGFDDIPLAAYTVPALTTVRMPIAEMVAEAVGLVIGEPAVRAAGPAPVLRPSLVVRASSGPVPALPAIVDRP